MSPAELYEEDFYEWTVRNAERLRSGRASEADLEPNAGGANCFPPEQVDVSLVEVEDTARLGPSDWKTPMSVR